jgi:cytochrome P450
MTVGTWIRWGARHGIPRAVLKAASSQGDLQSRIIADPDVRRDPYPLYEQVREQGAIATSKLAYLTVDHATCRSVLRSEQFRNAATPVLPPPLRRLVDRVSDDLSNGPLDPPALLAVEPPDHTRYRRLVSKVFTPRAIENLRGRVEITTDELLDRLDGASTADLVAQYARLLPVTVIAEILGVPMNMRDQFLRWGDGAAPLIDFGIPYRTYRTADTAVRNFNSWMYGHFDRLRANPGDDLLSQLVMLDDDGERLTTRELASTAGLLLAAGFETTVNLLGNGTVLLRRHPDQLAVLRDDPTLWGNAVEEVLRYESPVQNTARITNETVTIAGRTIAPERIVVVLLAGANRDPKVFSDPGTFDVRRPNAREHLSFSAGIHYCLGAALARMEGEIGLRRLFERYPDLSLLGEPLRRPTRNLRGYDTLPVSLGKRLGSSRNLQATA